MAPIIHTVNLCKVYAVGKERVVALNDVSISIEKGEFCCIVGQSGSGKSTLLNQLAGLEKPTRGKVFIGSHEISAMTEDELAKFRQAHLGFIFQSYNLLPTMTAAENVALPLMFKGISRSRRLAMARKELKNMGLGGRAEHMYIFCFESIIHRQTQKSFAFSRRILIFPTEFSVFHTCRSCMQWNIMEYGNNTILFQVSNQFLTFLQISRFDIEHMSIMYAILRNNRHFNLSCFFQFF